MIKRLIIALIGIVLMSIGVNALLTLNIGMGPVDTFTLLVQKITKLNEFGNASLLFHMLFAIVLLLLSKKLNVKIRDIIISILSIFFITRVVNMFSFIQINEMNSLAFAISFLLSFLILNLGLYLIAKSNIIIAPYDKFVKELANTLDIKIGTNRVLCDSVLFGIILIVKFTTTIAIVISWGTVIVTFFTGLNIRLYEKLFDKYINKIIE